MRTPSEYLAAAVRRVQSQLMPDCALTLTHGDTSATVTRVASSTRGEDEISGDIPAEHIRVLALASDLPAVRKGDLVSISPTDSAVKSAELRSVDSHRLVTSVRTDAALASLYVGLSCPFTRTPATMSGKRRRSSAVRTIRLPLDVLFVENGFVDNSNPVAPAYDYGYTVAIALDDWRDVTDPEVADTIVFAPRGTPITVKVSTVTRHDGWYILSCRTRD